MNQRKRRDKHDPQAAGAGHTHPGRGKVRRLADHANLYQVFLGRTERPPGDEDCAPDDDFAELLQHSLAGTEPAEILAEKEGDRRPYGIAEAGGVGDDFPPPSAELDLHGCGAAEAVQRFRTFIQQVQIAQPRTVRVVVGKGLHSQDKAVLPDVVEREAAHLRRQGVVQTFRWEHRRKRKSGSLLVCLLPAAGRRRR
ncbi:MAG: Smr/MutS family protein [Acidobacteria bacterium]|nr:Smr/MutS family protein [Acidobacteriota bacterium]